VFATDTWRDGISKKAVAPIFTEDHIRKADLRPEEYDKIKERVLKERRQERMRLAYVTITRAESLLFAVTANRPSKGTAKNPGVPDRSPAALLLRSSQLTALRDALGALIREEDLDAEVTLQAVETRTTTTSDRSIVLWNTDRALKMPWSVGSYSGIVHGLSQERRPVDTETPVPEGIFAFPRGANAGTALHTIFEKMDFIDAGRLDVGDEGKKKDPTSNMKTDELRVLIESSLTDEGISIKKNPDSVACVLQMIRTVMQSEIPQVGKGFTLGSLKTEDRLTEMEFYLSAGYPGQKAPVTTEELKKTVGLGASRIPEGKKLAGYMNGKVDLIFRYNKKWFILDWKSNHLGNSPSRYSSEKLEEEMGTHNYHLQYLFYTVALTRYLRKTTGEPFMYDTDFGGVIYIFLRGFDSAGNGVYFSKPPKSVIDGLDELL
jgi:exodeoxyribonuclease V beta subunit